MVARMRGPLVYCFEAVDNGGRARNIVLPRVPNFTTEHRADLLGGVTAIHGVDRRGRTITAVPYYAWDHREPGEMVVWVRQDGKSRAPPADDPQWQGKPYRTLDPKTLGPSTPPTMAEMTTPSASHRWGNDTVIALSDAIEPRRSSDHRLPRLTFWDHRGTQEWVQYDFDEARAVSAVEVYWFDDTGRGGCRMPRSWRLLYRDGDAWKPVTGASDYGRKLDPYNRVTFDGVKTTALRLEVQLQEGFSGGVLEWKVR